MPEGERDRYSRLLTLCKLYDTLISVSATINLADKRTK